MISAKGLSAEEARRQLKRFGPNEVIPSRVRARLKEALSFFFDPMGLMLLSLSLIHYLMGEKTDASVLLLSFIPITAVDVILNIRAQRVLQALAGMLNPTAMVYRDGALVEMSSKFLVPGDVILFEEGKSLPADGKVLQSEGLFINEALLTGESLPVAKPVGAQFFGGTLVNQGRGIGILEATGSRSQMGDIARILKEASIEPTPLQLRVRSLTRKFFWWAFVLSTLLIVLESHRGQAWTQSLLVGLTFAMSAIPEEFPIVFSLFLSLGAWRLSRKGVLVKRLPSVEVLGGVNVLCLDKTGTLTEGRFQLSAVKNFSLLNSEYELALYALMACEPEPADPLEKVIEARWSEIRESLREWGLVFDYPFVPGLMVMSHVWKNSRTGEMRIAMKGALEGVLARTTIQSDQRAEIEAASESFGREGKRVLALAGAEGSFIGQRDQDENHLKFIGLLVFDDPVRAAAKASIFECKKAGIEVKLVTGDHPSTAVAVAQGVGISERDPEVILGSDLERIAPEDLRKKVACAQVFARVNPQQKLILIQALRASGKVVAMTGDGVNDAPALKSADVGVSMGSTATDVARSAAQLVLLKNDLSALVQAIHEGRRIFSCLQRSFSYLVSFHTPIILLALIPPTLGWGDLLLPIHIVIFELLVHPLSAFAFENLPVKTAEPHLISPRRFLESLLAGVLLSVLSLFVFWVHSGLGMLVARTEAILVLLYGNIGFVLFEGWPNQSRRLRVLVLGLGFLIFMFFQSKSFLKLTHLAALSWGVHALAILSSLLCSVPSLLLRKYRSRLDH